MLMECPALMVYLECLALSVHYLPVASQVPSVVCQQAMAVDPGKA
jgi:hypothetical protein